MPPSLRHARTVLGVPWPMSTSSGAIRYRSEVPGALSYRAIVSFAAAESAVDIARGANGLSASAISAASLESDLLPLDHGRNTGASVVAAVDGRWQAA